ncbi:sensor domain-containing diguanylate cyclase [Candidatus Stoquefichus sp. SB1]|uniref:sensor domain-containing diguanylate cyclase n=1 Tax=Candidatus Stoquefichus sp. SB1 TaxID=1658109 RepID=UPI00067EAADF|nr:sensor domain-containing diguanylate cyclase [Candidatus Stoquefichus sp. SB1]
MRFFDGFSNIQKCDMINKETSLLNRGITMQKIIRKYLLLIMIVAMIVILMFHYNAVGITLVNEKQRSFQNKMDQMISVVQNNDLELTTLTESLNEDYLTRAKAFSYMIQKDASILKKTNELNQILKLLNVDELHVTNDKGIIVYSTVSKYVGIDFHDGKQTSEFLSILENDSQDSYLIQEMQPNTAEEKMMQYVGVSRPDEKGIVQVGLEPARLIEAKKRNTYAYIFANIPTDTGESLFAIDSNTGELLAHTDEKYAKTDNIEELGVTQTDFQSATDGKFLTVDQKKRYILTQEFDNIIFGVGIPEEVLYATRLRETLTFAFYLLLIYVVSLIVVNQIVNRYIISGVHEIIDDLHDIQKGHLDRMVDVKTAPELETLSQDINAMIEGILNATVKVSQIIEMTDVPIAAFECRQDVQNVLVTSRLKNLLHLDDEEAKKLFADKRLFLEKLESILQNEVDINTYCLKDQYYVKIHVVYEDDILGTCEDVTQDYLQRCQLRYKSEHDALTHLFIYKAFIQQVEKILISNHELKCAAAIMLDLDDFKQINDMYGHDFGDIYLTKFAYFLNMFAPDCSLLSRRSGDEFCMFLYNFENTKDIVNFVEQLWNEMSKVKLTLLQHPDVYLHASGGLAWIDSKRNIWEVMHVADEMLYKAKNQQKGNCFIEEKDF